MIIQYNLSGEWFDYIEINIEEPIEYNILNGNFIPTNITFDIPFIGIYNGVYSSLGVFLYDMFTNHIDDWRCI
jgi:hypothetical protein